MTKRNTMNFLQKGKVFDYLKDALVADGGYVKYSGFGDDADFAAAISNVVGLTIAPATIAAMRTKHFGKLRHIAHSPEHMAHIRALSAAARAAKKKHTTPKVRASNPTGRLGGALTNAEVMAELRAIRAEIADLRASLEPVVPIVARGNGRLHLTA